MLFRIFLILEINSGAFPSLQKIDKESYMRYNYLDLCHYMQG